MTPTLSIQTDFEFRGFSENQLRTAMTAVEPASHWKDPIRRWIGNDDLAVTSAAVAFFTATEVRVVERTAGQILVEADGYRAGPAGDR